MLTTTTVRTLHNLTDALDGLLDDNDPHVDILQPSRFATLMLTLMTVLLCTDVPVADVDNLLHEAGQEDAVTTLSRLTAMWNVVECAPRLVIMFVVDPFVPLMIDALSLLTACRKLSTLRADDATHTGVDTRDRLAHALVEVRSLVQDYLDTHGRDVTHYAHVNLVLRVCGLDDDLDLLPTSAVARDLDLDPADFGLTRFASDAENLADALRSAGLDPDEQSPGRLSTLGL